MQGTYDIAAPGSAVIWLVINTATLYSETKVSYFNTIKKKYSDTQKNCCNYPKIEQCGFTKELFAHKMQMDWQTV